MSLTYSVILCAHNPRPDYLGRVFEALKAQTLPREQWELLLVDNVSKPPLAGAWDLSWQPNARHIVESELGLTPARLRGIKESRGSLLIFIDDDNVLAPDFLEQAAAIAARWPQLGAFGAGKLEPEFEIQPAAELQPRLSMLALRTVPVAMWSNNPKDASSYPWGAGLCATRPTAEEFVRLIERLNIHKVLGRRGTQLFCGEDDLFSWAAVSAGYGFGIFPELQVKHLISAGRLSRSYFLRLIQGQQFSQAVIAYLMAGVPQSPSISLTHRSRILLHGLRHGTFAMQFEFASARGRRDAARFITEHKLRPLAEDLNGFASPHEQGQPKTAARNVCAHES